MCICEYIYNDRYGYLYRFVNIHTVKIRHNFITYKMYYLADIITHHIDRFIVDAVIDEITESLKNNKLYIMKMHDGTVYLYDSEKCVNATINNLLSLYEIIYDYH